MVLRIIISATAICQLYFKLAKSWVTSECANLGGERIQDSRNLDFLMVLWHSHCHGGNETKFPRGIFYSVFELVECETYDASRLKGLVCTLTSIGKESADSSQFGYTKGIWYTRKSAFFIHWYLHLFTLMHHSVLLLSLTQLPSHLPTDWIPSEGDNTIHLLVAFSNSYEHTWKNPHSSEVALICSTCSSCFLPCNTKRLTIGLLIPH